MAFHKYTHTIKNRIDDWRSVDAGEVEGMGRRQIKSAEGKNETKRGKEGEVRIEGRTVTVSEFNGGIFLHP